MVWLKIWKHDIIELQENARKGVVVWLKIWKHDIESQIKLNEAQVVVWLKIWKHDIKFITLTFSDELWFD